MEVKVLKNKSIKKSKLSKSNKSNKSNKSTNDDLLMLLNEAENITLDDLEFDNILKEQGQILCNINNIISGTKNENPVCNIANLKTDSKFKKILSRVIKKKHTNATSKHTKKKKQLYEISGNKHSRKTKKGKKNRNKILNAKSSPITIHNLSSKKKYLYRHDNKRHYDITITKPKIYIK